MTYSVRMFPVAEIPVPVWECLFGRNDCTFYTLIFYVWLIQGNGRNVLVDAGPPPLLQDFEALREACQGIDPRSTMKRLQTLEEVFAEAEITPESIDSLLITQPITYHSGGLVESLFPRAKVYVSRAGMLEFLLDNPKHPPAHTYFTESSWAFLRKLRIEDRLVLTDLPVQVAPGISFETTGGHHPGSAAVKVATTAGLVGILETAFTRDNIDHELPIGIAENAAVCRDAIRRYKRECDLVLAAHDNTLLQRFPGGLVA